MSGAGLVLDVLLIVLLLAALAYGWRLEKKLRAIREGQSGFAQAVGELNAAAARADAGLQALRRAADETHDSLHDRVLAARALKTELETLLARAERLGVTPPPRGAAPAARREPLAPEPPRAAAPAPRRPASRAPDDDLFDAPAAGSRPRRVPGDDL